MSIKPDKIYHSVILNKEFKQTLKEIAEQNNRSLNNMIVTILQDNYKKYIKKE